MQVIQAYDVYYAANCKEMVEKRRQELHNDKSVRSRLKREFDSCFVQSAPHIPVDREFHQEYLRTLMFLYLTFTDDGQFPMDKWGF